MASAHVLAPIRTKLYLNRGLLVTDSQKPNGLQFSLWCCGTCFSLLIYFVCFCPQSKSAHIIGFNWTNLNEIVFITNQGLEFYQVYS